MGVELHELRPQAADFGLREFGFIESSTGGSRCRLPAEDGRVDALTPVCGALFTFNTEGVEEVPGLTSPSRLASALSNTLSMNGSNAHAGSVAFPLAMWVQPHKYTPPLPSGVWKVFVTYV